MTKNLDKLFGLIFGRKILVVEDDPIYQKLFAAFVGKTYPRRKVFFAKNLDEAFDKLRRERIDLIITDFNLVGSRSGMDLWNECRYYFPRTSIIVTSGDAEDSIDKSSMRGNELPIFLQKPVRFEAFEQAVARARWGH